MQEALKLLRLELGLTQEDLAKKLNRAYVTVSRWENGKGFPSRSNAKTILEVAQKGNASADCVAYLNEVLLPETKRTLTAKAYGFPDIDRDFLFQLADGSTNALYVIDAETYRLLYANRKAESLAVRYLSESGVCTDKRNLTDRADKRCYHYFGNRNAPCEFCPLEKFRSDAFRDVTVTIPESGRSLRVHAKATEMKGRPVYIIYLSDVTQEDAERNVLYELTNDIPAGIGIYHVYMDDRIELAFMNNVLFNMVGEERGKALMKNGPSKICLVHPKDRPALLAEIKRSVAEKRDVGIALRMRMNGGQYQKLRLNAKMIRRSEERFTYYCVFKKLD